jgi:hypothetical protein
MFGLTAVTAAIMIGAVTMSSLVISAAAQPTPWCANPTGKPGGGVAFPCFPTREQCQAFAETSPTRDVCVPIMAR